MRIGLVCPYSLDLPGGVQNHVHDLAEALMALGHEVSVLAPADDETALAPHVVSAGKAVAVRYNGSVARVSFGPVSAARVRRWLHAGRFDVLHVHEPVIPSLSMLAVFAARGPVVATFHTSMTRSRFMAVAHRGLQLVLERITGRIAVSNLARRMQVEHLGGNAVEIPNGVAVARYAGAEPLPGWPGACRPGYGGTIGFLGRFTEPRKGFPVLREAFVTLARQRPGLRMLVAGPGDVAEAAQDLPDDLTDRVTFLGRIAEPDKPRMLRSVDIYVAPNIGGESFGMILTEAMAARTPVVASDLDAFERVLDGAGALFPTGDPAALAATLGRLLDDAPAREAMARRGAEVVSNYDWAVVATRVLEVYASAIEATGGTVVDEDLGTSSETSVM